MAQVKETEFFNTNYNRGINWYETLFGEQRRAVGEISNNYYLDPAVAERIAAYSPDMKVIFNLREPLELLQSIRRFGVRRGISLPRLNDFQQHVGQIMGSGYEDRAKSGSLTPGDVVSLESSVCLAGLCQPFLKLFPREQVYFLVYERIAQDPVEQLRDLYGFLGVNAAFLPPSPTEVVNASIEPRWRKVAQLAGRVSYLLRATGAYAALSHLHRSRILKRLLYRRGERTDELLAPVPIGVEARIMEDRRHLLGLVPELRHYWPDEPA